MGTSPSCISAIVDCAFLTGTFHISDEVGEFSKNAKALILFEYYADKFFPTLLLWAISWRPQRVYAVLARLPLAANNLLFPATRTESVE
jgi:hypothetical protein